MRRVFFLVFVFTLQIICSDNCKKMSFNLPGKEVGKERQHFSSWLMFSSTKIYTKFCYGGFFCGDFFMPTFFGTW